MIQLWATLRFSSELLYCTVAQRSIFWDDTGAGGEQAAGRGAGQEEDPGQDLPRSRDGERPLRAGPPLQKPDTRNLVRPEPGEEVVEEEEGEDEDAG